MDIYGLSTYDCTYLRCALSGVDTKASAKVALSVYQVVMSAPVALETAAVKTTCNYVSVCTPLIVFASYLCKLTYKLIHLYVQ